MLDTEKCLWKSDSYIDAVALGKKIKGRKEYIVVDTLELPHKSVFMSLNLLITSY